VASSNSPTELEARIRELEARVRDQEVDIQRLREERRELVAQLLGAEEQTRREVAEALHDDALQSLLAAHQELIEAAPGRVGVTRAHDVISVAIDRLREAVTALHPVTREQGGLEAALRAVAAQAERRSGFSCTVQVDPDAIGLHDDLILSVARELLTNAVKHASADQVSVSVSRGPGGEPATPGVVLEVRDDGQGTEEVSLEQAVRAGHVGLASVTQRLEAIGGTFALDSTPGEGSSARAWFPAP
jgi:two-component system, NarL family, sensor kinase